MKKLILKESQFKNIIDLIILEQMSAVGTPTSQNTNSEYTESWDLCGYDVFKKGDGYYAENDKGQLIKVPMASQLRGVIRGGEISFNDDILNGMEIGQSMRQLACSRTYPMQYTGASTDGNGGSWFLFIDDISTIKFKEPTPVYSIFTWNGSLRIGGMGEDMKMIKEKDGAEVIYQQTRTKNFILEISPAMAGRKSKYEPQTTPTKKPEFEEIKLDIQSPFEFDKVTLTPEAEQQFKSFVEKVKATYQGVTGDVEVICSASIDADENLKRDYNQRLSDNRANTIANRLKTETGITTLNFIPKGIGQTDQFAKGMKFPEVKDTNKTAPNRRLIIKMPTLKREKK